MNKTTLTHNQLIQMLADAGIYTHNTVGRRMALKLYDLLLIAGRKVHPRELPELEADIELAFQNGRGDLIDIVKQPSISDPDGTLNITAKRSLAALAKIGAIQTEGNTRNTVYWVELRDENRLDQIMDETASYDAIVDSDGKVVRLAYHY